MFQRLLNLWAGIRGVPVSLSRGATTCPGGECGMWNIVWRALVPPKMKVFAWRVITGTLATNLERNRRHIGIRATCGMCGRGDESSFHALLVCPNAASLWDATKDCWPLPNRYDIDVRVMNGFFTCLLVSRAMSGT